MAVSPIFVVLIAAFCHLHSVESTSLEVTPETFISGVTPNLTLKCTPGDTISVVSNILIFQLSKAGVLLASGRPTGVVLSDTLRTSKYSATDQIDVDNLSNSYLLFAIQFPEEEDEGDYKCDMNYEDKDGFVQHAECTFALQQNATDNINVQKQLDQTLQHVKNLQARIRTVEDQVFSLLTDNNNQSNRIAELSQRAANHIGFLVTLSDKLTILENDAVAFDKVKFNNGSGYNATSGFFVAPRPGFYALNLVCEVHSDVPIRMEMMLKVNATTVMKLFISGEARGGQQSGGLVYHMPAGSMVNVVVGSIQTDPADAQVQLVSEDLTYFSGYLLG